MPSHSMHWSLQPRVCKHMWMCHPSRPSWQQTGIRVGHAQVADDEVYLVLNAGCTEKDIAHISKHLKTFKVLPCTLDLPCSTRGRVAPRVGAMCKVTWMAGRSQWSSCLPLSPDFGWL